MLNEDELAALERMRRVRGGEEDRSIYGKMTEHGYRGEGSPFHDKATLADAMLRLLPVKTFPLNADGGSICIRWDDEITPERLVSSGWKQGSVCVACYGISFYPLEGRWWIDGVLVPKDFEPENMGAVWRLMQKRSAS